MYEIRGKVMFLLVCDSVQGEGARRGGSVHLSKALTMNCWPAPPSNHELLIHSPLPDHELLTPPSPRPWTVDCSPHPMNCWTTPLPQTMNCSPPPGSWTVDSLTPSSWLGLVLNDHRGRYRYWIVMLRRQSLCYSGNNVRNQTWRGQWSLTASQQWN